MQIFLTMHLSIHSGTKIIYIYIYWFICVHWITLNPRAGNNVKCEWHSQKLENWKTRMDETLSMNEKHSSRVSLNRNVGDSASRTGKRSCEDWVEKGCNY